MKLEFGCDKMYVLLTNCCLKSIRYSEERVRKKRLPLGIAF